MTIVEGQIETLKNLKESLNRSGITRFGSIGDIRNFINNYETEKKQLLSRTESELDAEIRELQSSLVSKQHTYQESKIKVQNELEQQIHEFDAEISQVSERRNRNIFCRIFYFPRISSLHRRVTKLRNNLEKIVMKRTRSVEKEIATLQNKTQNLLDNRSALLSRRCQASISELTKTKEVIDELYPLVAGAIGETSVVNTLNQLSDDYYLINDFSVKFNPPIYNKREKDRIFSIQIDHLLVCRSGVFLLETKNWSKASVENLDLRSPVKQILRTSYALFILLNSESRTSDIKLGRHHWGAKKIPIRNVIVMINEKPKEEFKHVKVVSLNNLIGYIKYFDQTFDSKEVKDIFEYLKRIM